jgi:hypothetical protein
MPDRDGEARQDGELVIREPDRKLSSRTAMVKEQEVIRLDAAFCPRGDNLMIEGAPKFDGFPGICLEASDGKTDGLVTLSPIHGDHRKIGMEFPPGAVLTLRCPVCHVELDPIAPCGCHPDGLFVALYTVPKRSARNFAGVCRVWGCYRSFTKDAGKIISEFRTSEPPKTEGTS